MMTLEEVLLAQIALRKRGYSFFYYYGDPRQGFTLRAGKHPPLSEGWWSEPYIELTEPSDLKRYLAER